MSLQWDDRLASGSSDIDTQHKELFKRSDSLINAFDQNSANRSEMSKVTQYLSNYVVFHFGNEEKYMEKYSYSSTSAHRAQHEQFVKTFEK